MSGPETSVYHITKRKPKRWKDSQYTRVSKINQFDRIDNYMIILVDAIEEVKIFIRNQLEKVMEFNLIDSLDWTCII